ncbi:MAG TPA: PASTA domain-containing protein [Thermoanaerobaculia bacterium]
MKLRGCLGNLVYLAILAIAFGASSYFWFKFFVRGESLETPNLIGHTLSEARAISSDLGLILEVDNEEDRNSDRVPPGAVVWQNRGAGSSIKRGTRLYVGQSLGPVVLKVPDLTGESQRTALLRFSQRTLKLGNVAFFESTLPAGIVSHDPPAGTVVAAQTPVSLLVAHPPKPVAYVMPDLVDKPLDFVRPVLEMKALDVSNVKFESYPGIADGIIIRQFPLPGAPVRQGDAIALVVSRQGAVPEPTPPPEG